MTKEERFLSELSDLSRKHGIIIDAPHDLALSKAPYRTSLPGACYKCLGKDSDGHFTQRMSYGRRQSYLCRVDIGFRTLKACFDTLEEAEKWMDEIDDSGDFKRIITEEWRF